MNDEQSQLSRLMTGGDQALADAMAQYAPRLLHTIELRMAPRLSGRVDAADVLQEAYLESHKRLAGACSSRAVFIWRTWGPSRL